MKSLIKSIQLVLCLISLSGCANQRLDLKAQEEQFAAETKIALKNKAKEFSEEELQNGEVPLYDFIQLTGKIIQSEHEKTILEGDRFILKSGTSQYQIFNEQSQSLNVGDTVTIYGEYYGFIKATLIEKE